MIKRSGSNKPSSLIIRCVVPCIQTLYEYADCMVSSRGLIYIFQPPPPSPTPVSHGSPPIPLHINHFCIVHCMFFTVRPFSFSLSSSPEISKLAQRRETPDLQSSVSESDRLMVEACQFSQFTREHPLEKWTVGSLPDLTLYW